MWIEVFQKPNFSCKNDMIYKLMYVKNPKTIVKISNYCQSIYRDCGGRMGVKIYSFGLDELQLKKIIEI